MNIQQLLQQAEERRGAIKGLVKDTPKGDVFNSLIEETVTRIAEQVLQRLPKPKDGATPVKGTDYFTEEEIRGVVQMIWKELTKLHEESMQKVAKQVTPIKGKDYFDGTDGQDGEDADEEKIIQAVLAKVPKVKDGKDGKNPDPKEVIDLLSGEDLVKKLRGLKGNKRLNVMDINDPTRGQIDMRWHGGGMSTGKYISGEVVSGSGTAWTLAHSPKLFLGLYAQGQRLSTARRDYTISDTAITTTNSWTAGDIEADYYKA